MDMEFVIKKKLISVLPHEKVEFFVFSSLKILPHFAIHLFLLCTSQPYTHKCTHSSTLP